MTTLSFIPGGLVTLLIVVAMVCGLIFYALYRKGDVRVLFSRGKTMFELEAKERSLK